MQQIADVKYIPKIGGAICHLLLFVIAVLLFCGRKIVLLRPNFILDIWPDFYQHISNFSISYILLSGVGFFWILMGVPRKYLVAFGCLIAFCNLIYELWIPILNTPDIIDAYYGFWGTASALGFLLLTQRYGLVLNKIV